PSGPTSPPGSAPSGCAAGKRQSAAPTTGPWTKNDRKKGEAMTDIIIVGAGVSGCAIARELSRYKADILVLDKEEDVCCGTSKANSAIVHAGFDARHGSLMARLNVEGSKRMPALAKELDFAYDQCGSLVVCLSEADRPRLQALYENGVANGVEG